MKNTLFSALLPAALVLMMPLISHAGVNKCTDAAGVVSYSDQPCSVKDGQKAAEIKNSKELAAYANRENERKIGKTCVALTLKRNQCYGVEQKLNEAFNANCDLPIKRENIQMQREQREQYERAAQERYARHPYNQDQQQEPVVEATPSCGEVQAAMWDFLKENFGAKLSASDIRAIEYNLNAVPADTNDPYYATRRRR